MNSKVSVVASGHGGSRIPWERVPGSLREEIESQIGGRVVNARSQSGGFSPGLAARLQLQDGRRFFVKAAGPEPNPDVVGLHRTESRIAALLPRDAPVPRLHATCDDGNWIALIFEDVEGHPPHLPWNSEELSMVLGTIGELAETLSPSPIETRSIADGLDDTFRGWETLAASAELLTRTDSWATHNLERLVALESQWKKAALGDTLLHLDIRADNLIIAPQRVVVVDWPHASIGARWIDLLIFLPSVSMQGGPVPWKIFNDHPVSQGTEAEEVMSVLAALAGFFLYRSLLPSPPGLPNLREFQRLQGVEALSWLREITGWN